MGRTRHYRCRFCCHKGHPIQRSSSIFVKIRIFVISGFTYKDMIQQTTFHLSAKRRGCHLVTQEILEHLPKPLPQAGMLNLFVQHTSCALTINENYDPDVRSDMETILNHMVKEREPYYVHTMEGPDDMPAHAKSSLFGVSLTIPITNGRLNLGTWQGIYLCEFRNHGGSRKIVATIYE